jgi:hypothetical protein
LESFMKLSKPKPLHLGKNHVQIWSSLMKGIVLSICFTSKLFPWFFHYILWVFVSYNVSANMVDVTLWEAFSIQLMNFITSRQDKGPIVLILTHAQCKLGGWVYTYIIYSYKLLCY